MKKIFHGEFRTGENIVNIGWQKNVEDELDISGLRYYGYISGYKDAADDLVDKVIDTKLGDSYVFPIVFLYRQYLELVLKNIIVKIYGTNSNIRINHDLSSLWNAVKLRISHELSAKESLHIDSVIDEFHTNDPYSFYFRYFWNKDFSSTLPEKLSVDLKLLKKKIDKVDDILFGSYG